VTPLHKTLGAELRGVDLTRPVTLGVFTEIEGAFNRYGILVFPSQPLNRGRPYDDTQRRVLHRTTVSDYANTLEQEDLVPVSAA
jgi:alpha-ketoglutarate-dependent taurine dioxygenase